MAEPVEAPDDLYGVDLADFVASGVLDPLSRVPGVGSVQLFGSQYAMRIWLDPFKLYKFGLTTNDVTSALQTQNTQVSAGQLGGLPSVQGQQLNATITVQSRLRTPEQFEGIYLRTLANGSSVYLRDVASVEIGAESYSTSSRYNRQPSAGVAVNLATGPRHAIRFTKRALNQWLLNAGPMFDHSLAPLRLVFVASSISISSSLLSKNGCGRRRPFSH